MAYAQVKGGLDGVRGANAPKNQCVLTCKFALSESQ
jgi:hypothetical protein